MALDPIAFDVVRDWLDWFHGDVVLWNEVADRAFPATLIRTELAPDINERIISAVGSKIVIPRGLTVDEAVARLRRYVHRPASPLRGRVSSPVLRLIRDSGEYRRPPEG